MSRPDFTTTILLSTSLSSAFHRINSVAEWWSKDGTENGSGIPSLFEGKSGALYDEFILRHGDVHYSKHMLVEHMRDQRIAWLVVDSELNWLKKNKHEWTGTRMIFSLSARGSNTALEFTHEGLVPVLECYEHTVAFWNRILRSWIFNSGT